MDTVPPAGVSRPGVLTALRRMVVLCWGAAPLVSVFLLGLTVLLGLAVPAGLHLNQRLLDGLTHAVASPSPAALRGVLLVAALQVGLNTAQFLAGLLSGNLTHLTADRLDHRVTRAVLAKAQRMPLESFEDSRFYDRMRNALANVSGQGSQTTSVLANTLMALVTLGTLALLIWGFNPWLLPLAVLAVLPNFLVELHFGRVSYEVQRDRAPELRRQAYLTALLSADTAVKEVRLLGLAGPLLDAYTSLFRRFYGQNLRLTRRSLGASSLAGLVALACNLVTVAVILRAALGGHLSVGGVILYTGAVTQLGNTLTLLLRSVNALYSVALFAGNLFAFLDAPELDERHLERWDEPIVEVRFEDVSFTYPGTDRPVLQHLDFVLRRGEVTALVGENGAGKTTLIKLLCALYRPTSGRILLNGQDAARYQSRSIQGHVSALFQDYNRYEFTLRDNVAPGQPDPPSEARVQEALFRSGAAGFVPTLPGGLDQQLGRWFEGGAQLSGGQWQKVALARAYYRPADVLILDEPTSALDPLSEQRVLEDLSRGAANSVTLLISHRVTRVAQAAQLLVLQAGRLVGTGRHEQLLHTCPPYREAFLAQARREPLVTHGAAD